MHRIAATTSPPPVRYPFGVAKLVMLNLSRYLHTAVVVSEVQGRGGRSCRMGRGNGQLGSGSFSWDLGIFGFPSLY